MRPDQIKVIVNTQDKEQLKILINQYILISEFICIIRRKIQLSSYESYFFLVNSGRETMLLNQYLFYYHNKYKDKNDCLIIHILKEQTFG